MDKEEYKHIFLESISKNPTAHMIPLQRGEVCFVGLAESMVNKLFETWFLEILIGELE